MKAYQLERARKTSLWLGVVAMGIVVSACAPVGNYRVVKVTKSAGEVALEGDRGLARQKADAYMKGQCTAGYDVLEEGEQVVGQDAVAQTRTTNAFILGPQQTTQSSTVDKREWRVKYQCRGANDKPQGAIRTLRVQF